MCGRAIPLERELGHGEERVLLLRVAQLLDELRPAAALQPALLVEQREGAHLPRLEQQQHLAVVLELDGGPRHALGLVLGLLLLEHVRVELLLQHLVGVCGARRPCVVQAMRAWCRPCVRGSVRGGVRVTGGGRWAAVVAYREVAGGRAHS